MRRSESFSMPRSSHRLARVTDELVPLRAANVESPPAETHCPVGRIGPDTQDVS